MHQLITLTFAREATLENTVYARVDNVHALQHQITAVLATVTPSLLTTVLTILVSADFGDHKQSYSSYPPLPL